MAAVMLAASANVTYVCADSGFSDLTSAHWAYEAVQYMSDLGYINGYEDGTYQPLREVTRAEFAAVMERIFALEEESEVSFSDLEGWEWYCRTIRRAVRAGYITGYEDGTVRPQESLTREQAAVIAARACGWDSEDSTGFTDEDSISDWARGAVGALAKKGIISGDENGCFRPKDSISRAETAKLLAAIHKQSADKQGETAESIEFSEATILTDGFRLNGITAEGIQYPVTVELQLGSSLDIVSVTNEKGDTLTPDENRRVYAAYSSAEALQGMCINAVFTSERFDKKRFESIVRLKNGTGYIANGEYKFMTELAATVQQSSGGGGGGGGSSSGSGNGSSSTKIPSFDIEMEMDEDNIKVTYDDDGCPMMKLTVTKAYNYDYWYYKKLLEKLTFDIDIKNYQTGKSGEPYVLLDKDKNVLSDNAIVGNDAVYDYLKNGESVYIKYTGKTGYGMGIKIKNVQLHYYYTKINYEGGSGGSYEYALFSEYPIVDEDSRNPDDRVIKSLEYYRGDRTDEKGFLDYQDNFSRFDVWTDNYLDIVLANDGNADFKTGEQFIGSYSRAHTGKGQATLEKVVDYKKYQTHFKKTTATIYDQVAERETGTYPVYDDLIRYVLKADTSTGSSESAEGSENTKGNEDIASVRLYPEIKKQFVYLCRILVDTVNAISDRAAEICADAALEPSEKKEIFINGKKDGEGNVLVKSMADFAGDTVKELFDSDKYKSGLQNDVPEHMSELITFNMYDYKEAVAKLAAAYCAEKLSTDEMIEKLLGGANDKRITAAIDLKSGINTADGSPYAKIIFKNGENLDDYNAMGVISNLVAEIALKNDSDTAIDPADFKVYELTRVQSEEGAAAGYDKKELSAELTPTSKGVSVNITGNDNVYDYLKEKEKMLLVEYTGGGKGYTKFNVSGAAVYYALTEKSVISPASTSVYISYGDTDRVVGALTALQGGSLADIKADCDWTVWSEDALDIILANDGNASFKTGEKGTADYDQFTPSYNALGEQTLRTAVGSLDSYRALRELHKDFVKYVFTNNETLKDAEATAITTETKADYVKLVRHLCKWTETLAKEILSAYSEKDNEDYNQRMAVVRNNVKGAFKTGTDYADYVTYETVFKTYMESLYTASKDTELSEAIGSTELTDTEKLGKTAEILLKN